MTGGSDSKVVLLNVASLASSDPVTEDEEEEEKDKENDQSKVCVNCDSRFSSLSLFLSTDDCNFGQIDLDLFCAFRRFTASLGSHVVGVSVVDMFIPIYKLGTYMLSIPYAV